MKVIKIRKKSLTINHHFLKVSSLAIFLFGSHVVIAGEGETEIDMSKTPFEIVQTIAKGEIINPFDPANSEDAKTGHVAYMETGCNGCHGGTGGGGMGPPLSNVKWVYGKDADTLFRLITLGTDELQKLGYTRKDRENVRAPMPPHASGPIVIESLTTERILQIIAWIQSLHIGK